MIVTGFDLETTGLLSSSNVKIYGRAIFGPRLAALETLQAPP